MSVIWIHNDAAMAAALENPPALTHADQEIVLHAGIAYNQPAADLTRLYDAGLLDFRPTTGEYHMNDAGYAAVIGRSRMKEITRCALLDQDYLAIFPHRS